MHAKRLLFPLLALSFAARAQPNLSGTARIHLALERLRVLGSVLVVAAHPDDENTALLAYFARGRGVRAGYLSVTRGEGGQNLIGPEQGDLLGVIRTQELLAARRIDGAEQFFTRAIDFGFSKSAEETLEKWGRERILSDLVWVIRRFRPDVVILRFAGASRDGHGHHQVSGMLGREAFFAAADRSRFPEQLRSVQPWRATRLLWNTFGADPAARLEIDTGQYDPILGCSYAEIAGMSRSMHRSQGFGAAQRRGPVRQYLVPVAGEPAEKDVFDGVDTTWNRVPGGAAVDRILAEAVRSFEPAHPERIIPLLVKARPLIAARRDPWAAAKLDELDEAVALCAGLWLDAAADRYAAEPGSRLAIRAEAINRSPAPVRLVSVALEGAGGARKLEAFDADLRDNQPVTRDLAWQIPEDEPCSTPFWLAAPRQGEAYAISDPALIGLAENPPALRARFRLRVESEELELLRPVRYRYVDRVLGELARPFTIVPRVALQFSQPVLVFPDAQPKKVEVEVKANAANASGEVRLETPAGWRVEPKSRPFQLSDAGEQVTVAFELTPSDAAGGQLRAVATAGARQIALAAESVAYPHIPPQTVFLPAEARLVRAGIRVLAKKIGYVMGAGDQVPEALRQLGCELTLLSAEDLALGDLGRFDAIVTGVRAYNVRPDLRANQQRLLEYVKQGGTLVVQYNVLEFGPAGPGSLAKIGPYPLRVGRERVSAEEAPVAFPAPRHPLLESPNKISAADFDGWIQERGLYFASEWDPRYEPLFESHDPGEPPHPGGTLLTRYGQGAYVFTAYSWFRQLPAGVPGAYRIFANLLSSGKTAR